MGRREEDWKKLRALIGAGPQWPVFPTRRNRITEMQPGEKLLVIRKLGGLGDILMISALFPDLFEQFPDIEITFAVPEPYQTLFENHGTKLNVIPHSMVYGPYKGHYGPDSRYHKAGIQKWALDEFDVIEDISFPCAHWETLMKKYKATDGETGLKWRNRMDRWSRWMGFELKNPRTIINLTADEIYQQQHSLSDGTSRPTVVWSPISAKENRSYPWWREVRSKLEADGFNVWFLHNRDMGEGKTMANLSFREYGATVAAADIVLTMDTATFHWGGLLGKKTIGLFNLLLGMSHAKFYPTAEVMQFCDTPCIAARYDIKQGCEKWFPGQAPRGPEGQALSKCFFPDSVDQIVTRVKEVDRG